MGRSARMGGARDGAARERCTTFCECWMVTNKHANLMQLSIHFKQKTKIRILIVFRRVLCGSLGKYLLDFLGLIAQRRLLVVLGTLKTLRCGLLEN